MVASGKCRICGKKSVDSMPCYSCTILMIDAHNKHLTSKQRFNAFTELDNRYGLEHISNLIQTGGVNKDENKR